MKQKSSIQLVNWIFILSLQCLSYVFSVHQVAPAFTIVAYCWSPLSRDTQIEQFILSIIIFTSETKVYMCLISDVSFKF